MHIDSGAMKSAKARLSESDILKLVMLRLGNGDTRLFRNNVGQLQDRDGRFVRYGVANPGGSDLIGWRSVVVSARMVGQRVAVFAAIETKTLKGRATEAQMNFLRAVEDAGGIAILARSPDDAVAAMQRVTERWEAQG